MSEMSEGFPGIFLKPEAVHHTAEGSFLEVHGFTGIEDHGVVDDTVKGIFGADVEIIRDGDRSSSSAGRIAVGFSRWNSSWDPDAKKGNPTLN